VLDRHAPAQPEHEIPMEWLQSLVPDCVCCLEPRSGQVRPSTALTRLSAAVDELTELDPTDIPEAQALADLALLLTQVERLRVLRLRRLVDAQRRQLHHHADEPTLASWVRRRHDGVPGRDVALSRSIRPFSQLYQAVEDGSVSLEAAAEVARVLGKIRSTSTVPTG
jgi:hypothetical protein